MSYALIDNASLTAVQRLLGQAPTRTDDSTDGDIVAFENLLQGILFFSEVIAIDDYKPEFRTSRMKEFSFIRFVPSDFGELPAIRQTAETEAKKIKPQIKGGEFVDEIFRNLIDQLKMHIICTWDISSSIYYLTMKMLGQPDTPEFEKYGKLAATIFSELNDAGQSGAKRNDAVELYDSRGRPIGDGYRIENAKWGEGNTGGLTSGLAAFVAALNWLTVRSLYYTYTAKYLGAESFLYPIRQHFQINYLNRLSVYDDGMVANILHKMRRAAHEEVDIVLSANCATTVTFNTPLFSAWLVNKTRDVGLIIEEAISLRDKDDFVAAREQLGELRLVIENSDHAAASRKAQQLQKGLNDVLSRIRKNYGISTGQGMPIGTLVKVYNTGASLTPLPSLPEFDISPRYPAFIDKWLAKAGFAAIYRDVVRDLMTTERLGELRTLLGSAVSKVDEPTYSPRVEDPKYRYSHSKWKSPM